MRDVLLARADLLVRLDLPRRLVMARILRRTLRRRLRREVLWHDDIEPPLWTFRPDHIPAGPPLSYCWPQPCGAPGWPQPCGAPYG